jgi:NTP pyrophosphatase (non-canonical NTP hydrolase)
MGNIFKELETWRRERGLDQVKTDAVTVFKHVLSEVVEGMEASVNGDFDEVLDALGDVIVFAINGIAQMNADPEIVMEEVLKTIHSRKGYYDVKEQKFKKTITGQEYSPDFSRALLGAQIGGQSTACTEDYD